MKKILLIILVVLCSINQSIGSTVDDEAKLTNAFNILFDDDASSNKNNAFCIFRNIYNSTLSQKKSEYTNHMLATYGLGLCYYNGFGVERSYDIAFLHFSELVSRGFDNYVPEAGFYYGECCYNGYGTKQDSNRARISYYHSALFGSASSKVTLGYFLANDEENMVKGHETEIFNWLKEEADKNSADAQYVLGHLYLDGKACSKDEMLGVSYLEKSANNGFERALYELAKRYSQLGKFQNYPKAFSYYTILANRDDAYSQYYLGVCYSLGKGTTEDNSLALRWYKKAADGGCADALYTLGDIYYKGEYVQKDNSKALSYYKEFLSHQYDKDPHTDNVVIRVVFVKSKIGDIYYEEKNYEMAVKYYLQAVDIEQITSKSAKNLAICYKWGYGGLLQSNRKSEEWLEKAIELGNKEASKMR